MRRPFAIAGLIAALSLGAAPAVAFQETPVPSPPPGEISPQANPPALDLANPTAPATATAPDVSRKGGLNVFGYNILPKLDFGLDLLYGQEQQPLEFKGPTIDDNGDVSVLGKVKRRF
jgi:hypothetical protein